MDPLEKTRQSILTGKRGCLDLGSLELVEERRGEERERLDRTSPAQARQELILPRLWLWLCLSLSLSSPEGRRGGGRPFMRRGRWKGRGGSGISGSGRGNMLLRSSTPRLSPAVGILLVCGLFWGWGVVCGRERERERERGSMGLLCTT
jgi:hypothetical protein